MSLPVLSTTYDGSRPRTVRIMGAKISESLKGAAGLAIWRPIDRVAAR